MEENVIKGYLGYKGEQGLSAYEVAVANGYTGTVDEWLKSLGTSSMFSQFTTSHSTTEETTDFELPEGYIDGSIINVYIDGSYIAPSEYSIVKENDEFVLRFNEAVTSGHTVEISALNISTNNLPISSSLNSESTNETASSSKVVYDTIIGVQNTIPKTEDIIDLIYPVGSIYMTVNRDINPGTILPNTTWQPIGQGRTLIGAGTGKDSANVSKTFESGANGGWYNAVAVSHNHSASTGSSGGHSHGSGESGYSFLTSTVNVAINGTKRTFPSSGSDNHFVYSNSAGSIKQKSSTSSVGGHTHSVNVNSNGVSGVNRNIQPYLVVNMWVRTA